MSLYVDSSALLKRYFDEADAAAADELLSSDPVVVTARLTMIEVRRNIARVKRDADAAVARESFRGDLARMTLIELDAPTCDRAVAVAEVTGVRTLDALHLAAAQRVGVTTFLTFDLRQAQAGRTLGFSVVGA